MGLGKTKRQWIQYEVVPLLLSHLHVRTSLYPSTLWFLVVTNDGCGKRATNQGKAAIMLVT